MFRLVTAGHSYTVHLWWWNSPVPSATVTPSRSGAAAATCPAKAELTEVQSLDVAAVAALMTRTAYRRRRESPATPPGDQKADASRH